MIRLRFSLIVAVLLAALPVIAADPPCDLTADGVCDLADMDLLGNALGSDDPLFDLNGDGVADLGDRDEWLMSVAVENGFGEPYLLGDANFDGAVDAQDLMTVGQHWQFQSGVNYSEGDFNMDDRVNAIDLNLLGGNWQKSISVVGNTQRISPIPEPSGALLSLVMFVGI